MSLVYTLTKKSTNGQLEASTKNFDAPIIIIGRGASSDILLTDTLVALEHARITSKSNGIFIEDLESFSGTRVNDKLVTSALLKDGDQIHIGTSYFQVKRKDGLWHLDEFREAVHEAGEDTFTEKILGAFSINKTFPAMWLPASVLMALVLLVFFIYPFRSEDKRSWLTGSTSNPHRTFINDCSSCHQVPFTRVQDETCLSCHKVSDHSPGIKDFFDTHPDLDMRCASCHHEHRGSEGLTIKESALCASCHASLSELHPETKSKDVSSFHHHPQFRITHLSQHAELSRTSLDNTSDLIDSNTLKLNHEVHLKGLIAGKDGFEKLDCNSCHQLSKDKKSFLPVTYEKDCMSCHALAFTMEEADMVAPHANPDQVYQFIRSFYADLFLEREGKSRKTDSRRKVPGTGITRQAELEYARNAVTFEARTTERELFTKTACIVCHEVRERSDDFTAGQSAFTVIKPETPATWMPASEFNHLTHQYVSCQSCHGAVEKSEKTSDVLLPGIESCLTCHHDTGADERVVSDCSMCHPYHYKKPLPEHKRITLKEHEK